MKPSLKKDTLAYQFGVRPSILKRDIGHVHVPAVVMALNTYMEKSHTGEMVGVEGVDALVGESERDAVIFYMLNHACSVIRQKVHEYEPLGDYLPIVEEYHRQLAQRSVRMFYYMLLICTRESRHVKTSYSDPLWGKFLKEYGPVQQFHQTIKGIGSDAAATRFRENPPNVKLGNYANFLVDVFYKGQYNSSYGGPAWGKVADVLRDFVVGKITAEMMMDTSFTLAHNTGPIFNKGMLFEMFNSSELIRILDVQRAGMIPQFIGNKESKWSNDGQVAKLWDLCHSRLPDEFSGFVDWYAVEELGSVHKYPSYKDQQVKKYGPPAKHKAAMEAQKLKQQLEAKKLAEMEKNMVQIMPGLKVQKVEVRP